MEGKLMLYGFNNLTKTLSFNIYDVCYTENEKARKAYEAKLNKAYYTSPKFVKDTAIAAGKKVRRWAQDKR